MVCRGWAGRGWNVVVVFVKWQHNRDSYGDGSSQISDCDGWYTNIHMK